MGHDQQTARTQWWRLFFSLYRAGHASRILFEFVWNHRRNKLSASSLAFVFANAATCDRLTIVSKRPQSLKRILLGVCAAPSATSTSEPATGVGVNLTCHPSSLSTFGATPSSTSRFLFLVPAFKVGVCASVWPVSVSGMGNHLVSADPFESYYIRWVTSRVVKE